MPKISTPSLKSERKTIELRILVHIHLYYFDMWQELKQAVQNITVPYDLFVTVTEHNADIENDIRAFKSEARIILLENKGFDVWPFIKVLNDVDLNDYDYIVKLHSKRDMPLGTLANGFDLSGDRWRRLNLRFLETKENFNKVLSIFEINERLGMNADYRLICRKDGKGERNVAQEALKLLEFLNFTSKRHSFVMGTMFIARSKLLEPLKQLKLNFAPSNRGKDKTPYALERLFGYLIDAQGYQVKDVLNSPVRQIYGKIVAQTKGFIWRKKITSSGNTICKFCKIPVFIKTYQATNKEIN